MIVLAASACKTSSKTPEKITWNWLRNDVYEISYPENWTVDTSGKLGTTFFLYSPPDNKKDLFKENVNLLVQYLDNKMTLNDFVNLSENQVKTMIREGHLLSSERQNKGQQEYHKMLYTGIITARTLKFEQYYWIKDSKAYILTLTTPLENFDRYQQTGERMLNSFKLR